MFYKNKEFLQTNTNTTFGSKNYEYIELKIYNNLPDNWKMKINFNY